MRRVQGIAFLSGAAPLLSACAGGGAGEPAAETVTVTETQTAQPSGPTADSSSASAATESASPAPADGNSASSEAPSGSSASDEPSAGSDPSDSDAPILGEDRKGEALTLSDFFSPGEGWDENRYDVADQQDITGIAGELDSCGAGDYPGPAELEMRLANNFESLSFTAGQANGSESSDQVLVVRVEGNGGQLDIKRIPFNETATFDVGVEDVNSLVVQTYLDDEVEDCSRNGSTQAVFWDFELQ